MDQQQIIDSLMSGNSMYVNNRDQWQYLYESYQGGEIYRDGGYLMRYQLETPQEYQRRLLNTPLDNHCQSVISVYISFLFREEPQRDFMMNQDPMIQDFLRDADLDGRSLNSFMKDVATWASVFGHCWVVIAKPDVGAVTRADEIALGARPYVNLITPLAMLDWRFSRQTTGRYGLDYIKYVEDINGDIRVIKEWTPELITTTTVDYRERKVLAEDIQPNGLGLVPAVCAYNGRSMIRGVGVSDIADIADAQRMIYNLTSEIQTSAVLDSHPSLVTTPDTQIGTGAGSIIQIPENLDPGLRPYLLEYSGASISQMLETIQHTIDSIDKMANIGAVRAVESRTVSGVAMETEFQLLNARLAEKADQMELAEEGIWRIWCLYQGYAYNFEIDYPGSFNIRDVSNEYEQLTKARAAGTDPIITEIIDRKIIELLGEDPDMIPGMVEMSQEEMEPHEMLDPATGDSRRVTTQAEHEALMAQGWVHEDDYASAAS